MQGVFTHFLWSSAAGDSTLLRPDAQTYLEEEGANTAYFIYIAPDMNESVVGTDPPQDSGEGHFDQPTHHSDMDTMSTPPTTTTDCPPSGFESPSPTGLQLPLIFMFPIFLFLLDDHES